MGFLFVYNINNNYLCSMKKNKYSDLPIKHTDILLIGAGIMSATLGTLIKKIRPTNRITIIERLPNCGLESSDSLNNAGTGHAGYCELNYTPMDDNGNIDIAKAVKVNIAFGKSLEFWGKLRRKGILSDEIYHEVPHYTFVEGAENVEFLRKRHYALRQHKCFSHMTFTNYAPMIKEELPLIMEGREMGQDATPVAMTKSKYGIDVNYGLITKELISGLKNDNVTVKYNEEVIDLYKDGDFWYVIIKNLITNEFINYETEFVFYRCWWCCYQLIRKIWYPRR